MSTNLSEINDKVKAASDWTLLLRNEIAKSVVGQKYLVDRLLTGILANGHVLLEGVPGLAKTLAVKTMAAAMVNLARYRGRDFFWDPFCGSGTICIEAAMIALNRATGLNRSFGAEKWACVPKTVWQTARSEAMDREFRGDYRILGTDIDPASLEIARANAAKAGVGRLIEFREADATKMSLPSDRGLIVCNPPYGERMLEQRSAQRLYQAFGRHIKFADGWKKYIISSEPEFEHYFGKPAAKKRKLYNGRLQCNVYMYF